jgi:hypothetical protein
MLKAAGKAKMVFELHSIKYSKQSCLESYWGADKSLARPRRKQATATEDFDVHTSYLLS